MDKVDFKEIILTKDELKYLKELKAGKFYTTSEKKKTYNALRELDFVEYTTVDAHADNGDRIIIFKAIITETGRRYLLYFESEKKKKCAEWIRYGITTAIAIAAFVKSFFF